MFEARIKLPAGRGLWPAFWMLPTDNRYGDWAASGEIDIMEADGRHPDEVCAALHFGGTWLWADGIRDHRTRRHSSRPVWRWIG